MVVNLSWPQCAYELSLSANRLTLEVLELCRLIREKNCLKWPLIPDNCTARMGSPNVIAARYSTRPIAGISESFSHYGGDRRNNSTCLHCRRLSEIWLLNTKVWCSCMNVLWIWKVFVLFISKANALSKYQTDWKRKKNPTKQIPTWINEIDKNGVV